jgi:hypothetical protein
MQNKKRIENLENKNINIDNSLVYMELDLLFSQYPKKYTEEEMKRYREWKTEQGSSDDK